MNDIELMCLVRRIAFTQDSDEYCAAWQTLKDNCTQPTPTNTARDAIAAGNEYCRSHPTTGDRAMIFLAGVEWRQQHP